MDDATKGFRQTITLSGCDPLQNCKDDFSSRKCSKLVGELDISNVQHGKFVKMQQSLILVTETSLPLDIQTASK
jgi:hypothetical protein